MIITTFVLVKLFSESVKQVIFCMFNLLQNADAAENKNKSISYIDSELGIDDSESDYKLEPQPESSLHQYSLRERKAINYKV